MVSAPTRLNIQRIKIKRIKAVAWNPRTKHATASAVYNSANGAENIRKTGCALAMHIHQQASTRFNLGGTIINVNVQVAQLVNNNQFNYICDYY